MTVTGIEGRRRDPSDGKERSRSVDEGERVRSTVVGEEDLKKKFSPPKIPRWGLRED